MEVAELQQQLILLRAELRKEQEEKCRVLAKSELLELEIQDSRDSEKKMLESLIVQTKQLERTKISLEEAKLEMKHLNGTIQNMKKDAKEVQKLRVKLAQALEAEEKSRKAMDGLAVALKEVTTESNRAKKSYSQAQVELERLQAETEQLRSEAEESSAAWRAKESGFINCIKISEEEITCTKQENKRLMESKQAAREEISNMRDIVKQAVKESNIVKQALEIARRENSQFRDLLIAMPPVDGGGGGGGGGGGRGGGGGGKTIVKWNSMRDPKVLEGSIFDILPPSSPRKEKDGGNGDGRNGGDDDDDVDEHNMFEMDSPMRLNKKRQGICRIGEMLRLRSFHK